MEVICQVSAHAGQNCKLCLSAHGRLPRRLQYLQKCMSVDNLHLHIVLGCAHEQKAHGLQWLVSKDGANKTVFATLVGLAKQFKA